MATVCHDNEMGKADNIISSEKSLTEWKNIEKANVHIANNQKQYAYLL